MAKKRRLLWHIYPTYLLVIIMLLAAATWFGARTMEQFYIEQTALDLEARMHFFEGHILEHFTINDERGINRLCKKIGNRSATRITVILPHGKVIGDSSEDPEIMDNHANRPEIRSAVSDQVGMSIRYSQTLKQDMMYVGIPLKENGKIAAVLRAAIPLTSIDMVLNSIRNKMLAGGIFIAILAAFLSLLVSRFISRPIEEIRKGAEGFARGEFDNRLPIYHSEEIASLADTMNKMAGELKLRINTITRQQEKLEVVLSSMAEGVIAIDNDEHVISMNQSAGYMLEVDPSKVQGRSIQEVIRNIDLQKLISDSLYSETRAEEDIILYSDKERVLQGHGTPLNDEAGMRIGALIVLNDVTRLMKLESIRKDFVANVSHEIKTPITAIKGFVETLVDGAMNKRKDADRFLKIIEKHADRLDAIIEDLLSLSRIEHEVERGEIVLEKARIHDVLQTVLQICEIKAAPRSIKIELSCDKDLSAEINPPLMEQAIINLLDNAIKYSDDHSTVQLDAGQIKGDVIIDVRDRGCGIGKEHLSRLFERFYRIDKARSREMGGTGLGLAIVKHIVQAHKGRVDVESTLGTGSTFSIIFPSG